MNRAERRSKTESKAVKQSKIAKQHNLKPKKLGFYKKKRAMDCGNPRCMVCGNPRKLWKSIPIKEKI